MRRKPGKPVLHNRDHEHGGADPVRIHFEDVGDSGGGAGGGGIQFDTDPQAGGFLTVTVTDGAMTLENTGPGDTNVTADQNVNLTGGGIILTGNSWGGIQLEVTGGGDLIITVHSPTTNLLLHGLPTTAPGFAGAVWNDSGTLKLS